MGSRVVGHAGYALDASACRVAIPQLRAECVRLTGPGSRDRGSAGRSWGKVVRQSVPLPIGGRKRLIDRLRFCHSCCSLESDALRPPVHNPLVVD